MIRRLHLLLLLLVSAATAFPQGSRGARFMSRFRDLRLQSLQGSPTSLTQPLPKTTALKTNDLFRNRKPLAPSFIQLTTEAPTRTEAPVGRAPSTVTTNPLFRNRQLLENRRRLLVHRRHQQHAAPTRPRQRYRITNEMAIAAARSRSRAESPADKAAELIATTTPLPTPKRITFPQPRTPFVNGHLNTATPVPRRKKTGFLQRFASSLPILSAFSGKPSFAQSKPGLEFGLPPTEQNAIQPLVISGARPFANGFGSPQSFPPVSLPQLQTLPQPAPVTIERVSELPELKPAKRRRGRWHSFVGTPAPITTRNVDPALIDLLDMIIGKGGDLTSQPHLLQLLDRTVGIQRLLQLQQIIGGIQRSPAIRQIVGSG